MTCCESGANLCSSGMGSVLVSASSAFAAATTRVDTWLPSASAPTSRAWAMATKTFAGWARMTGLRLYEACQQQEQNEWHK
jgi:hypothetical protein